MKRKYKEYTDEEVIRNAKTVYSIAGLLRTFGLKSAGSNYINMKRTLQRLNVDTSHWTGQAWRRNQQLKDFSKYTRINNAKKHLLKVRGNVCECCGLSEWLGKPLKLEIHHKNGDRTFNEPENLELLCPNCHSYTDTWRTH